MKHEACSEWHLLVRVFKIVAFLVFVYFSRFRYGLTCICLVFGVIRFFLKKKFFNRIGVMSSCNNNLNTCHDNIISWILKDLQAIRANEGLLLRCGQHFDTGQKWNQVETRRSQYPREDSFHFFLLLYLLCSLEYVHPVSQVVHRLRLVMLRQRRNWYREHSCRITISSAFCPMLMGRSSAPRQTNIRSVKGHLQP